MALIDNPRALDNLTLNAPVQNQGISWELSTIFNDMRSFSRWRSQMTINGWLQLEQRVLRAHSVKDDWDEAPSPPPIV